MNKILVTGGCGYIGAHTVIDLLENGHEVISIDDNSRSSDYLLDGIEKITGVRVLNIDVDLSDTELSLEKIRPHGPFHGIIHFAA